MGIISLIHFSLLIRLVFQKHDKLFPNSRKLLTIWHITVWNNSNCVIIGGLFPGGRTREWNLPLLTGVLSGAKTSAEILITLWQNFENPVILRSKTTYILLLNDTSSCWITVVFCAILSLVPPLDCLVDDTPNFSGLYGSSLRHSVKFYISFPGYLQKPHVHFLQTKYDF